MTFNELLDTIVTPYTHSEVTPKHAEETLHFVKDILATPNHKVIILGDWDVDGIHSAKIVYNDLYTFGLNESNIEVYFGDQKAHGINYDFIRDHLGTDATHVIIVDSSTNSLEELTILKDMGLKTMVIDHHSPEYVYDDYAGICTIENSKFSGNEDLFEISAGYLCTILSKYWRERLGCPQSMDNQVYGYITLHSDGCLLYDPYIKPIVMFPEKMMNYFPKEIQPFTTKWTKLNRNFVSFSYCPRINNLCRHNRADLLKLLFFEHITDTQRELVKKEVEDLYQNTKEEKNALLENCDLFTEDLGFFTLVNLNKALSISNFDWEYLVNATGFIAGAISEKLHKPTIAYIDNRDGYYKLSGRDETNKVDFRDFLRLYNLEGGGHVYAAGFKVPAIDFEDFKMQIYGDREATSMQSFLVWDVRKANTASILRVLPRVAKYNEVAISKLKPIYLKLYLGSEWEKEQIGKLRKFSIGRYIVVKDLQSKSDNGQVILAEPDISSSNELRIVYKEELKND